MRRADAVIVDTLIVGAGFAGIGVASRLKREGVDDFLLIERAASVGGTWRDNVYPGVACDIPSHLYSFSFHPNPGWTALFAPGREIATYLADMVQSEGLDEHLRVGTEMLEARWTEHGRWRVRTSAGEIDAGSLVLACGRLSEPRFPPVPGLDGFHGESFHSARWPDALDLTGKRVALVGSGASAVQLLPHLVDAAREVVLLQRSAPYVVPRRDRPYSAAERRSFSRWPEQMANLRDSMFWRQEELFEQRMGRSSTRASARRAALAHLHSAVKEPERRAALTPHYEYGCKRVLLSDDFYPAVARDEVRLIPSALAEVRTRGVVAENGESAEVDIIVYATGFHSTEQPYADRIRGRGGALLAQHWENGMRAFASTVVAGFPNLFVLNGPNAGLGHNSAVFMIEAQIELVLRCLREGAIIEPPLDAESLYTADIDLRASDTVWMTGGCTNWYVDRRVGRLTLLWPDFAYAFSQSLAAIDPSDLIVPEVPVRSAEDSLTTSR